MHKQRITVRTTQIYEEKEGKEIFSRYFEIVGNAPIVQLMNEISKPKKCKNFQK